MSRLVPLKQPSHGVSTSHVKLPPVKWINFTMHESQFLSMDDHSSAWIYTWKAILLASGVPHDDSTFPARFLLSKHDDHALAVLLRTTIAAAQVGDTDIVNYVTGKPIFEWISRNRTDDEVIEIVYPSQLSSKEAGRFSVHDKPLHISGYEIVYAPEGIEPEVETESEE